jgi:hypothetical protein
LVNKDPIVVEAPLREAAVKTTRFPGEGVKTGAGVLVVVTVVGVVTGCGVAAGVGTTVAMGVAACGVLDVQPVKKTVRSNSVHAILTRRTCRETNVHFIFIHPFYQI